MTTFRSRARGALLGLIAGDALGVPVEGMGRDEFRHVTGMQGGGSHGQPAGTWSDDGSLVLCTLESLVEKDGLDPADLGDRFLRWLFNRHWAARRVTFGVGFATREAIVRIREGVPAEKAGLDGEDHNGNGSLVRMLPIALWAEGKQLSGAATVALAHAACRITHAHPRAQLCCGLFCLFARGLAAGKSPAEALAGMREAAAEHYASDPWNGEYGHLRDLMEREWRFVDRHDVKSSGYVVHTFEAAVWCLVQGRSFEETVLEAVNLGDDADTVGAVVGGLAGLVHGDGAVPPTWRQELARLDEIERLVEQFLARLGL